MGLRTLAQGEKETSQRGFGPQQEGKNLGDPKIMDPRVNGQMVRSSTRAGR